LGCRMYRVCTFLSVLFLLQGQRNTRDIGFRRWHFENGLSDRESLLVNMEGDGRNFSFVVWSYAIMKDDLPWRKVFGISGRKLQKWSSSMTEQWNMQTWRKWKKVYQGLLIPDRPRRGE
jgi:hypothetical protein